MVKYVSSDPLRFMNKVVGNGQCVTLVKAATGAPASSSWKQGDLVRGNKLPRGTAIATFQNGKYRNLTNGQSHGAVYLTQDNNGIYVVDQWKGQPGHVRLIRFKGGVGAPHNDGDAFSVVV